MSTTRKTNWIAFIGAPNAGKSTLVNALVGQKIAIVSPKVQTTRTSLKGIRIIDETQLIFIDTPGIFQPKTKLDSFMVNCAWQKLTEADLVCLLIDVKKYLAPENLAIIQQIKQRNVQCNLVLNKVDLIPKMQLFEITEHLNGLYKFDNTFMISALKKKGVPGLVSYFMKTAHYSEWGFNDDEITNAPVRFLASEIVREKLFFYTQQEIPYSIHVDIESWEEKEDYVTISVLILVQNQNHKKIVIGKGGNVLKVVGTKAREDIQELVDKKVVLKSHVKVSLWKDKFTDNTYTQY